VTELREKQKCSMLHKFNVNIFFQVKCFIRIVPIFHNRQKKSLVTYTHMAQFRFFGNSYLFNEFVCNFGFFWHEWTSLKLEWNESFKGPRVPKKAQITQERVEYNVFLFDEPLKGSKSLKIFKISLTFRFDKLSNLSKSVHIEENSQILTVSNKKEILISTK
jgi:hypothetical protein